MSTLYSNNIRPVSGTTDAISIDSSTNKVGINSSSPTSNLQIHEDSTGHCTIDITNTTTTNAALKGLKIGRGSDSAGGHGVLLNYEDNKDWIFSTSTGSNNATEKMRISAAGDVRFGTDDAVDASNGGAEFVSANSAELRCSVTSTGNSTQVRFYNGNGEVGSIKTNGSATAFNTSSDYRLKENEVAISDGVTRLKTLKPYRFNFKADPSTVVDGFFAHEVKPAVPEAISGEKDGEEIQGIDQSKLVPLLTAALQESIAKIEALEARVAALESQA